MSVYRYADHTNTIVSRIDEDGISRNSCSVENPHYLDWLSKGNLPDPFFNTLISVKDHLKQRTTELRDQVQYGGANINGLRIKTDPMSIALLDQALMFSQRKPNRKFKIKTEAGVHIEMTASQIADLFDTLGERTALCWDTEANHYSAIDALLTIESALLYDITTGWPV